MTLIEVMVTLAILAMLLGLSVPSLRVYWFKQSLYGARDALTSEMARTQSLVTSETHPLVYGLRFSDDPGYNDDGKWGLIRYNPTGAPGGTPSCTQYGTATSGSGFFSAPVKIVPSFTPATPTAEQDFCRANLKGSSGAPIAASGDQFLLFYARGTATGGSSTLHQPNLGSDDDLTITVHSLTGRAE